MWGWRWTLVFFLGLFALVATGFAAEDGDAPFLFRKVEEKGSAKPGQDTLVIRAISAVLEVKLLESEGVDRVRIPLPDGEELTLLRRRTVEDGRVRTWLGTVEGEDASFFSFTWTGKALAGHVEVNKRYFQFQYLGDNLYRLAELDRSELTEVDKDGEVPDYGDWKGDDPEGDGCPDPASDIDVMVVYTDDAELGAGGAAGMEALIYESVFLTNLSYENSDIMQRVRLVHHAKVAYTEAADSVTDRERLRHPSDGFMDGIHALRDAHGADIVMLITETTEPGNCGRAYIMDPVSPAHADFAFGVVRRNCAADNLSFPHELGHIMSARHQNDTATTPFAYGHGHFELSPADGSGLAWETIMSKRTDADRGPRFSNPDLSFSPTGSALTDPMGIAASSDNHRVLNNTASTVANFRCSSPSVDNVWMKDRWEDTGLEPDPATAGKAMYHSPYIWIRNTQDPTFLAQHQHENPVFGSTNWIYAKLHNGNMASQSGQLELYVADASISLSWPSGWTLVTSIPVTLSGSSTEIVEHAWTNVPDPSSGSHHYCMIARWVSATDPMTTPETTNISNNVRANNNIVWRNLNVVDADGDSTVVMNVAGLRGRKLARIVFEDQTLFPKPQFTETGEVYIGVDRQLAELWKSGGAQSTGLLQLDEQTFKLQGPYGHLDNIPLPAKYSGQIKVYFKKSEATPASTFHFAVQHYSMDQDVPERIGGVDYEIHKK